MNYADKIKVSKMAIIGEKDLEQGKITIKDMVSGNQELVDIDNIVNYLKETKEIKLCVQTGKTQDTVMDYIYHNEGE